MPDQRLDAAMAERVLARSRTHAASLIASGVVTVDGRAVRVPAGYRDGDLRVPLPRGPRGGGPVCIRNAGRGAVGLAGRGAWIGRRLRPRPSSAVCAPTSASTPATTPNPIR